MKKYKFTDNLGLKIIAVIFAAFLWLIVVNLDNPVSTQTFSEVPVTIINEDIILSAGDTYLVLGEEKVSVVVSADKTSAAETDKRRYCRDSGYKGDGYKYRTCSDQDFHTELCLESESAEAAPRNLQDTERKIGKESPFPYGKHRGF